MKYITRLFIFIMVLMSLMGCSSKLMTPTMQLQEELSSEQASVTFFRYSSFGGAIQTPIAEMVGSDLKLVGIASVDTKIRHIVSPGEHIYVIAGEGSELVQASFEAGKNYYVRIEPRMGVWKARFVGVPISPTELLTEKTQNELKTCEYVSLSPEAEKWFLENKKSMLEKYYETKEDWEKEDAKDKAIIPENYGVSEIY